jgi:hypothetical protein
MKTRYVLAAAALVSTLGIARATIKTVAVQGDPAPVPFTSFRRFTPPAISDAPGPRVADYARTVRRRCIVKLDPDGGPDAAAVCEHDPSPDGGFFQRLAAPTIDSADDVAWSARETFGRQGVFRGDPSAVALTGDPVPAPGTGLLKTLSFGRITEAGDVAFQATISGGAVVLGVEVNQGLFRCTGGDGNCSTGGSGTLETLVLVNDAVPDRVGRRFCSFVELAASDYGIVFRADTKLDCADGGETALRGVFRKPFIGAVQTIALVGEASEPFPSAGGTTYDSFDTPAAIESGGAVAFVASTTGVLETSGVYRCDPPGCPPALATEIVQSGDLDAQGDAFHVFSPPAISAARDVAFTSRVIGSAGSIHGLFVRRAAGGVDTIVRTGDAVPGASPPAAFRLSLTAPGMSQGGKIAFQSKIRRTIRPRTRDGLFAVESPSGAFLDRGL